MYQSLYFCVSPSSFPGPLTDPSDLEAVSIDFIGPIPLWEENRPGDPLYPVSRTIMSQSISLPLFSVVL